MNSAIAQRPTQGVAIENPTLDSHVACVQDGVHCARKPHLRIYHKAQDNPWPDSARRDSQGTGPTVRPFADGLAVCRFLKDSRFNGRGLSLQKN